jgi:hypothetical protein
MNSIVNAESLYERTMQGLQERCGVSTMVLVQDITLPVTPHGVSGKRILLAGDTPDVETYPKLKTDLRVGIVGALAVATLDNFRLPNGRAVDGVGRPIRMQSDFNRPYGNTELFSRLKAYSDPATGISAISGVMAKTGDSILIASSDPELCERAGKEQGMPIEPSNDASLFIGKCMSVVMRTERPLLVA